MRGSMDLVTLGNKPMSTNSKTKTPALKKKETLHLAYPGEMLLLDFLQPSNVSQ